MNKRNLISFHYVVVILPIQCRTGCKQQVNYEQFPFSDGFVYLLPKNLDGSIHDCQNLRIPPRIHHVEFHAEEEKERKEFDIKIETWSEDEKNFQDMQDRDHEEKINEITHKQWKELFDTTPNQYYSEYSELAFNKSVLKNQQILKSTNDENILKKLLLNTQIRCVLFPSPFHSNPNDSEVSDLIHLSNLYEKLKNFDCAITACLIQDKISMDQTTRVLDLIEKQRSFTKNIPIKIESNITAKELRDKNYRIVENLIKSFIRKKYKSIKDLQKDFPILFIKANEKRERQSRHIVTSNEDVIEYLTFGACVKILKENKKDKDKLEWDIIDNEIIQYAYFIVDRRNDMDHFTDENIERSIPPDTKVIGYIFSNYIIDFFKKIENI